MNGAPALIGTLLALLRGQPIVAPDVEAGLGLLAAAAPVPASREDWRGAVAAALAEGLIHDPVTLPPGALQCHWRLELAPRGFDAARRDAVTPPLRPASGG